MCCYELVLLNLLNNYLLYYSTIATFLNFEKSTECQQKKTISLLLFVDGEDDALDRLHNPLL